MNDTKHLTDWFKTLEVKNPLVIAGPCSAETEAQVLETAHQIKNNGIDIFRAGIWKPRTRPNCFEGVGAKGLLWLQKVKAETGMFVATEVANAKHVELALNANIDIIWIGARTTVNPFAVQEIADALKGTNVPVLIKNPINPDLELWIGALERLYAAGIHQLAAIHRGFSTYQKIKFRNEPQWQIAIDLKRRIPQLPIFCDPSHISGKREYLAEVTQKAMDLNYNGLIIESHCNPAEAWSDAAQQITPQNLATLLNNLIIREPEVKNEAIRNTLNDLRFLIDDFDSQLLDLLEERMKVVEKIGRYKKENNISVLQSNRWNHILERIQQLGTSKGFSKAFINTLFKAIHQESINHQEKIMNR